MNLIRTKEDNTQIHILCKDHVPNYAMKNEFQTSTFSVKIIIVLLILYFCISISPKI